MTVTVFEKTFSERGRFVAFGFARVFLRNYGFSAGPYDPGQPVGIRHGRHRIDRWRNLSRTEHAALHGVIVGDIAGGPLTVRILATAPAAALAAIRRENGNAEPAAPDPPPQKPKGGRRARLAGILCNEQAFQKFLNVQTAEAAANALRARCAIDSRARLDHDPAAAAAFDEIDISYRLWLDGYDVAAQTKVK
jgi:hypothetical protein